MVKFNAKNLTIAVFFGILIIGVIGIANAQEALPKGGDGFETAVKLEPGNYQEGGSFENKKVEYFYFENVKPGQEVNIKGTFTAVSKEAIAILVLYNEDRIAVVEDDAVVDKTPESISGSWLPNADKASYKYYIKTGSDLWAIASHSLDISLIDRYDAGSQTDAGDIIEKAMSVQSGEYKAYLSGKEGTDAKDFYKVAVKKGQTLAAKVTPPSEASINVTVYDSNRAVLKEEYAPNPGAIVTNSVPITKSGNVFVGVVCDRYCSKELVAYTLNITKEGVIADEEEYDEEGLPYYGVDGAVPGDGVEKGGLNWALILGIIAFIVIVGIVVYSFLKKKKKKEITDDSLNL